MTVGVEGFDTVIHAPHRLQICAVLDTVDQVEFAVLRETLGVSESVLSKQVKALEEAGYVTISKGTRDKRVRTWASFTSAGAKAYRAHVAALRRIVGAD
ncbi:MarR family transcriptional regulator [Aeromicrobium camelliae]|uniref:MarR family transcriptional regulator n=1 Tax=Aeromicrobium camelliae TaxID=1538144 RepID=A0A3N6WNU9_9ACTN|nr:transcriptional regulator [Aeromicrobium camelliae]RQN03288.1 MarR family transcriptional regulator [Aeromicrobium camelliae]